MMQIQKKMKKCFLLFMTCSICHMSFIPAAQAADTTPQLSQTKITIPVYGKTAKKLSVINPEKDITYIFQSTNKKVVTVNKKTGLLTGKKAGTTTVTLLKQGKKKNTLVSSCKVTVVKAKITKKNQKITTSVNGTLQPVITYENSRATYTYKSSNKKIVKVGEKIDDTGATSLVITALKKGKATLTITEKYKKKKSVVGTIAVTVKEPSLDTKSISMLKGQTMKISNVITISNQDTTGTVSYEYQSSDDSVLEILGNTMTAKKVASDVSITVYQVVDTKKKSLGKVTVTISEASEKIPEASVNSNYIDLSDYENDYEDGFDNYDDNDYYTVGSDYVEDETVDADDSYDDYENYLDDMEHTW